MSKPIEILTDLSPGTVIDPTLPFVVEWSGGDSQSIVRMRVSVTITENVTQFCELITSAAEGRAELGTADLGGSGILPLPIVSPVEVTLIEQPADPGARSFSAAGLTLGGRHVWRYEHRFNGLVFP